MYKTLRFTRTDLPLLNKSVW